MFHQSFLTSVITAIWRHSQWQLECHLALIDEVNPPVPSRNPIGCRRHRPPFFFFPGSHKGKIFCLLHCRQAPAGQFLTPKTIANEPIDYIMKKPRAKIL